jgi:hypothetical protein
MKQHLEKIAAHHRAALAHHRTLEDALDDDDVAAALKQHAALGRSLKAAQQAVRDALETADYVEPSHDPGAQTSDGFSPRSLTPEERRQRDQRKNVEFCYEAARKLRGLA